ncbi:DUF6777 domain-containing protein [Streptomyces sp. NPDC057638]|uniref:DUF6777 domain-containing protein n=1 Tax=Streptomyces sp. NPDC057638 TaxID=3346190 RepID=UPI00368B3E11
MRRRAERPSFTGPATVRRERPERRPKAPADRPGAPVVRQEAVGCPAPSRRARSALGAAVGALLALPLLAGCGTGGGADPDGSHTTVFLRAAAARGPDPYTASTARTVAAPAPSAPAEARGNGGPQRGQTLRAVSGTTPGLYAGTRSVGSCDAERHLALLRADPPRAAAFARDSGIARDTLPGFVRGLTPVVLRADTRVTDHGYRTGATTARQAVLQAGSAVLVDAHGMPRVRCAGGNPLRAPVAARDAVVHEGRSWAGYRPERTVVVRPAPESVDSLILLDAADGSWITRETGTDGERDLSPDVVPPGGPDDLYAYPPAGSLSAPDGAGDLPGGGTGAVGPAADADGAGDLSGGGSGAVADPPGAARVPGTAVDPFDEVGGADAPDGSGEVGTNLDEGGAGLDGSGDPAAGPDPDPDPGLDPGSDSGSGFAVDPGSGAVEGLAG